MVLDIDFGTAAGLLTVLIGSWWALVKIMFSQFERRQDERFSTLTATLTEQKNELDAHMRKQDAVMADLRRVELSTASEIRRVENELRQSQIDSLARFQTKTEATSQYTEILQAIRALGERIDKLHARINE